mmetsp:Transcript_56270/g.156741  ORF Transcript_56270/g.156741 Transcript_56270/m.156741 type:complete len:404 (-) Transcript_56270:2200-3411(-)
MHGHSSVAEVLYEIMDLGIALAPLHELHDALDELFVEERASVTLLHRCPNERKTLVRAASAQGAAQQCRIRFLVGQGAVLEHALPQSQCIAQAAIGDTSGHEACINRRVRPKAIHLWHLVDHPESCVDVAATAVELDQYGSGVVARRNASLDHVVDYLFAKARHLLLGATIKQAVEDDGVGHDALPAHQREQLHSFVQFRADAISLDERAVCDEVGRAVCIDNVREESGCGVHVSDAAACVNERVEDHEADFRAVCLHFLVALQCAAALFPLRVAADDHGVSHREAWGVPSLLVDLLHVTEKAQSVAHAIVAHKRVDHLAVQLLARDQSAVGSRFAPILPSHVHLAILPVSLDEDAIREHPALLRHRETRLRECLERGSEPCLVPEAHACLQRNVHEHLVHLY